MTIAQEIKSTVVFFTGEHNLTRAQQKSLTACLKEFAADHEYDHGYCDGQDLYEAAEEWTR